MISPSLWCFNHTSLILIDLLLIFLPTFKGCLRWSHYISYCNGFCCILILFPGIALFANKFGDVINRIIILEELSETAAHPLYPNMKFDKNWKLKSIPGIILYNEERVNLLNQKHPLDTESSGCYYI